MIPIELVDDAGDLIEHYDVWLEEFERKREGLDIEVDTEFVYAGPSGYPFSKRTENNFKQECSKYRTDLLG